MEVGKTSVRYRKLPYLRSDPIWIGRLTRVTGLDKICHYGFLAWPVIELGYSSTSFLSIRMSKAMERLHYYFLKFLRDHWSWLVRVTYFTKNIYTVDFVKTHFDRFWTIANLMGLDLYVQGLAISEGFWGKW